MSTLTNSGLPLTTSLSEGKELLGPGTDTISSTLAHILYALAHDLRSQEELVRDCAAAGWPEDIESLEVVPRLRAAVKEGIRWAASATAVLPRVTPAQGAIFEGRFICGGVRLFFGPQTRN